ncbi:MAG: amidase domain-containing protein [Alkaliphilus sp.]|nr:amidase domain-containing protein [Alkaliphilus sp.]
MNNPIVGLIAYDRENAVAYANKWALLRNPRYADFQEMGGDCTNYASQVIHAGGCPMNYQKYGWYYNNLNDRAPAWTSVKYLYEFLVNNKSKGPVAVETDINGIQSGDIIQLNFGWDDRFDHSPVVIDILPGERTLDKILIAAHTIDRLRYPVSNYNFKRIRFLKIKGYRE